MTPLERAARALCASQGDDWEREGHEGLLKNYSTHARAVLMAIREPSEGMLSAGGDVPCDDYISGGVIYSTTAETRAVWQAMLDSALEE